MKIDLSGRWDVCLESEATDVPPAQFRDSILLPGTTSAAGLGDENPGTETGCLTDTHPFSGTAWYRREISLPDMENRRAYLFMERTRKTKVYFDGRLIGSRDSLCTPHLYPLPYAEAGAHILTVRVENRDYPVPGGHMTSPDTQSNWNGITGEISLTCSRFYIEGLSVLPDPDRGAVRIRAHVLGQADGTADASIDDLASFRIPWKDRLLDYTYTLPFRTEEWSEETPRVYTLRLDSDGVQFSCSFGFRSFAHSRRRLLLNGHPVFLRGKTESLIFPKTGFAPTDLPSWLERIRTAKEYGINHLRCHTCCPPDAAFAAADREGVFLEPELPFWGTLYDREDGRYADEGQQYLFEEGKRILKAYGSHPSFVMFSLGNEMWGSRKTMSEWIRAYREIRPDILFLSGSNNFFVTPSVHPDEDLFCGVRLGPNRLLRGSFAMCDAPLGRIQTEKPHTDWDYDACILPDTAQPCSTEEEKQALIQFGTGIKKVERSTEETAVPQVPVLSHEVGQYTFYPRFDEAEKYTGPLKPRYLKPLAKALIRAGLYDDRGRFFQASGRLSADCYRAEIEAALRSRELSGFQLLDLQDFPGQGIALVGILDAFMESKGVIAPEVWRRFCADTAVLARLPGFVFTGGEELAFTVQVSSCTHSEEHTVHCSLRSSAGESIRTAIVSVPETDDRLSPEIPVRFLLPRVERPEKCVLTLCLENGIRNEYPLVLLPLYQGLVIDREGIRTADASVRFVSVPGDIKGSMENVIVIPSANQSLPAEYAPDFWCYPMFKSISQSMGKPEPIGTMGLSIDQSHPLLRLFPTEDYTTPVWYPILLHAHCEEVRPRRMIVEMIDNPSRCRRFGILYEKDGRIHMTARLWEAPDDPAVRAFAFSLLSGITETR